MTCIIPRPFRCMDICFEQKANYMKPLFKILVAFILIPLLSHPSFGQGKWVAPSDANNIKNPLEGNPASVNEAKSIYMSMCTPCHGNKGRGDGPAAPALNPRPADHSAIATQSQTDGVIFWKITNGRGAMQAYKTTLTENQRWGLVNYIRTLKR
jgi:mono/diheme cytochrome c family protein